MSRILWSLYIIVCVIQCVLQLHIHTETCTTHTNTYNFSYNHRHTCPNMEVTWLLLSYTCALSSNAISFILLPESSLSVQKTQDPKKKSKPWWHDDLYRLSHWFSSFKMMHTEICFSPSSRDPRGNPPQALTREAVHWGKSPTPSWTLGKEDD